MNEMNIPQTGHYIVITRPIVFTNDERLWGRQITWKISRKSIKTYNIANSFSRIDIPLLPGHWFEIANGFWPKKCHSGPHYPILALKIERSVTDRKDYKKFLMNLIRQAYLMKFLEDPQNNRRQIDLINKLEFSCTTRNLDISTERLNGKCEIYKTRAEAKARAAQLLNAPKEVEPTRWQRLET